MGKSKNAGKQKEFHVYQSLATLSVVEIRSDFVGFILCIRCNHSFVIVAFLPLHTRRWNVGT